MADVALPAVLLSQMYQAALNVPPCAHFEGGHLAGYATCIFCKVDAAAAALLDGCEVQVQRQVTTSLGPDGWRDHHLTDEQAVISAAVHHGYAERRLLIATSAERITDDPPTEEDVDVVD